MKETTADRLKFYMESNDLKQVDLYRRCLAYSELLGIRIGKNDISQYVSGKVVPGQEKLTLLGKGLNVSEAWLMGYDVPMRNLPTNEQTLPTTVYDSTYSMICEYLSHLNSNGLEKVLDYVIDISINPNYQN